MRAQRTFQNEVEMWDARQHLLAGISPIIIIRETYQRYRMDQMVYSVP